LIEIIVDLWESQGLPIENGRSKHRIDTGFKELITCPSAIRQYGEKHQTFRQFRHPAKSTASFLSVFHANNRIVSVSA
jgi:hypothetical protein